MTESLAILDSPGAIREHLWFVIGLAGAESNAVCFVVCDHRNVVLGHVHAVGPPGPDDVECARVVSTVAQPLSWAPGGAAVLLALTRPGPKTLIPSDRRWYRAVHEICARHEVRMLGVYVVTPRGHREVLLDDAL